MLLNRYTKFLVLLGLIGFWGFLFVQIFLVAYTFTGVSALFLTLSFVFICLFLYNNTHQFISCSLIRRVFLKFNKPKYLEKEPERMVEREEEEGRRRMGEIRREVVGLQGRKQVRKRVGFYGLYLVALGVLVGVNWWV